MSTPRCQSKLGADACTDPDCPERVAKFQQFMAHLAPVATDQASKKPSKLSAHISNIANRKTPVVLEEESLDEATYQAFARGDCWALAYELHQATGWDLVAFGEEVYEDDDVKVRGWCHMAVRTPAGLILDMNGLQEGWESLEYFPAKEAEEIFDADDPALVKGMDRYYPNADAKLAAKRLLAKVAA